MKKINLLSLICLAACAGKSAEFTDLTPIPGPLAPEAASVQLTPAYVNQLAEEMRTNHPALLAADSRTNAAAASLAAVRT